MGPKCLDVKGVPFDPNFLDHLILIIYLTKVLKKGSSKIGGLTLKAFRPQMSKKTAFFEDFWQNFFHFSKIEFFDQIYEMRDQKKARKNLFFLKTHQYLSNKVGNKKCKFWINHSILACVLIHKNAQSHQYDGWKSSIFCVNLKHSLISKKIYDQALTNEGSDGLRHVKKWFIFKRKSQ